MMRARVVPCRAERRWRGSDRRRRADRREIGPAGGAEPAPDLALFCGAARTVYFTFCVDTAVAYLLMALSVTSNPKIFHGGFTLRSSEEYLLLEPPQGGTEP